MSKSTQNPVAVEVAELMRGLQQRPVSEAGPVLTDLTKIAVRSVSGAEYAGITIGSAGGSLETTAPTHQYVVVLDDIARRCHDGPYMRADSKQHFVVIDDLAADPRWPQFRDAARSTVPVASVLSFQLFSGKRAGGALNFYADAAGAFDDESIETGLIFATHAAFVVGMLLRDRQFRSALASRDIIGQAKGIMMERFNVSADRAFEMLKRMSQDVNVPVSEVAERLVGSEHPSS